MQKPILCIYVGIILSFITTFSFAQVLQNTGSITGSRNYTDTTFRNPLFIDVNSEGDIFVLDDIVDSNTYYVLRYNSDFEFIRRIRLDRGKLGDINFNDFKVGPNEQFYIADGYQGLLIFNSNGTFSGNLYMEENNNDENYWSDARDLEFDKDSNLYIASYSFENFYINKLDKNLKFIEKFQVTSSNYLTVKFTIDNDGNIYVNGNDPTTYSISIYKYSPNTKYKPELFIPSLSNYSQASISSIFIDLKNTLWVKMSDQYASIQRYGKDGKPINDIYRSPNAMIYKNRSIYLLDEEYYTYIPTIERLTYVDPQPVTIIGKRKVPLNTMVSYSIYPKMDDHYYYNWTFSGRGMLDVKCNAEDSESNGRYINSYSSEICLYATDTLSAGWLTCEIGNEFDVYSKDSIYIEPALNTQPFPLTELTCQEGFSDCSQGNIESIRLNDLVKNSDECNDLGYWDFTTDTLTANIFQGQYYSAEIQLAGPANKDQYAGIWIDFNNDGDFDDQDEFIGTAISFDGKVKIINIEVPPTNLYTGEARMRVRARPLSAFDANEACMRIADEGETEDYTVKISEFVGLAAPNAVTPNQDGKNDFFVIKGISGNDNSLVITDSFGKSIFETTNYQNNWPEQSNESKLPKGTYYYFLKNSTTSINGFLIINY